MRDAQQLLVFAVRPALNRNWAPLTRRRMSGTQREVMPVRRPRAQLADRRPEGRSAPEY